MTTNKRTPWTPAENAALVCLYFSMLDSATAGDSYNKAELIRLYRGDNCDSAGPLAVRSRGSIEAKLMNASAAHRDISEASGGQATTMAEHGYKAWGNYQAALKDAMRGALIAREGRGQLEDDSDELGLAEFDRIQCS